MAMCSKFLASRLLASKASPWAIPLTWLCPFVSSHTQPAQQSPDAPSCLVARLRWPPEAWVDDRSRQRADQRRDPRDSAGDDSARLRCRGSQEISRIQARSLLRQHGIFGVARGFGDVSLAAARNFRIGLAHRVREPGEPDVGPRRCSRTTDNHPASAWSLALANDSRSAL